jgi:hypothetical protein
VKVAISEDGVLVVEMVIDAHPLRTHAAYLECGKMVQAKLEERDPGVPDTCGLFLLTLYMVTNNIPIPRAETVH